MKQIRKGVFETNSSSTHSIAIPKKHAEEYPNVVHFGIGEFGWEFDEADPADYLYTAILAYYYNLDERAEKLDKLKAALEAHDIRYTMDTPAFWDVDAHYLDNGYIDHSSELGEFLDAVFADDETLLDFIFYGLVFTGNDNSDEEARTFTFRDKPTYTEDNFNSTTREWTSEEKPNPYYKEEYNNYDWYEKWN